MADNTTLNAGSGGDVIASDDVGGVKYQVVKLAVGADGAANLVANANPVPVSDAGGAITVDNGGTFATQVDGAALAALQLIDDPVFTDDAAFTPGTSKVMMIGAQLDATGPDSVDEGDAGALRMTADRAMHVSLRDSAGNNRGANVNASNQLSVSVDNTVTVASHAVTNAGTFATQVDGAALTALQLIDNIVAVEDAVAGSGYSGVPFLAVRQDSHSDLAADGDFMSPTIDADGGLRVSIVAGAGSGGTAIADGATFTRNTTSLTPAGAVVETSAPTLTNGDVAGLSQTTSGSLRVAVAEGGVTGRAEDSAHSSGHEGVVSLAVRRDSAAVGSDTDGDYSTLNVDANGRLYTNIQDGGNSITVDNGGTFAVQVSSIAAGNNNIGDVDVATLPAVAGGAAQDAAITGNPVPIGLRASTATPSAMSGDGDVVYPWATREGAQVIAGAIVDDAAFTPGTSRVVPIAFQADETATDSVDEGDAGAPRMTLDRKVITTSYAHAAAGGWTPHKNLDVDESEDDIKTSPGKLGWIHVINLSNAVRYIKFYNATAANVTVGTTTPVLSFPVPTMADTNGAGFVVSFGDAGVQFDTAICVAATTGLADNNTGAPGANEVVLNCGYL